MSDPIKVGIIRCDTHGAYFAPLMASHDPLKLQRPVDPDSELHHSWMGGGAHFYFYGSYSNPISYWENEVLPTFSRIFASNK